MRFDELDLEDEILDGLDDMNFQEMTPVQEHTIPVILEGRDIIGCAQTGTGKTAAYTLPLLNRLLIEGNEDNVIKSVIIVPTRELAQQIDQQFQGFSYYLPVSTTVVYGGGDGKGWDVQKRGMLMGSDVVIATPGRMISHIQNSGIDLSHVECLILDEADRMLDMGFSEDIMKIVSYMPKDRQTIMFSATLPPKIREMARTILRNPAEVNIAISKPNEAIDQSAYVCYENQKLGIIREMFAEPTDSKTIIFSSSKLKVKELAHTLKRMKLNVAAMHSDLEQAQREEVMLDFKNNKVSILVATDIVARGIDNFSFNCHLTTLCFCILLIVRKQYDLRICYLKTDSNRIQHFIHSLTNSFILYGKANFNLNIDFSGIIKKCIATGFLYFRHSL